MKWAPVSKVTQEVPRRQQWKNGNSNGEKRGRGQWCLERVDKTVESL